MRRIELSQGHVTMVDDEDFELVSRFKWYYGHGYATRNHEGGNQSLHRFLMGLARRDGIRVDHVNGDKLDNRRSNLRVCPHANSTSGYKGVCIDKRSNEKPPWHARITTDGKRHSLGTFSTKEAAALAYDAAAKELHGEFALLNFEVES